MAERERFQAELRRKIIEAYRIVDLYRPLIDAYVVDFFHLRHWDRLSPNWTRFFAEIPIKQLPELLSYDQRSQETTLWPLAVLALRSLFRRHMGLFQKSVKLKKRHEIEQFAINCSEATPGDCRTVVDIGSGQGNLARTLAFGFGFRVCCIEQNESFVHAARQKDAELWRRLVKQDPTMHGSTKHPVHLNEKVNLEHIDPVRFVQMLRDAWNIEKEQQDAFGRLQFGLIGLHPCGDLAPSLLRLFLACPECRFVKLVCCCYMKLSTVESTSSQADNEYGFPLSDFCRDEQISLSYEAREISCHAIEQYREKLGIDYHELKVHAYRAAIESIIVRLRPDLKHSGLKGGIKANEVSFEEYCHRAVVELGLNVPQEEIHSEETRHNLERWEEVVKFYTLRLMFAPLVETIILYDRLLFLLEKGAKTRIDVLFDPYLSPRNHVITAFK